MPSRKRSGSSERAGSRRPAGRAAANGESWRARDRRVLWHPFTPHTLWETEDFPVIVGAEGSWLVDADGRRYLDGVSSIWCNLVGHRRAEIDRAVAAQLKRVAHATFLGATHPPAIELAERLVEIAPRGLGRVFYSDNGSTAMEIALKMAFQYWQQNGRDQRTRFLSISEGYHGDTVGAMSAGAVELFHGRFKPLMFQSIRAPSPHPYRCAKEHAPGACAGHVLEEIAAILKTHARTLAGVVVEPLIQGAGGMIVHPRGFLKGLRDLCTEHDVFLIVDEVMTGFGRTGTMFACEQEGVTPDLMAVSKGLTGGYLPLAATLATPRIFEGFLGAVADGRTFYHGHTYTGNPLGCAAALATLEFLEKDRTLEKLRPKIERLHAGLRALGGLPHVGDVRLCGFIGAVELVQDKATKEPFPFADRVGWQAAFRARDRGVLLRPLGNVIVVMPPLTIADGELQKIVDVLAEVLTDVPASPAT